VPGPDELGADTTGRLAAGRSWACVLCLDPPRGIGDADVRRDAAVSHYVGWTQQDRLMRRAGGHAGAGMGTCVLLVPGIVADEERLKTDGTRPRCGQSLNYRAEADEDIRRQVAGTRDAPRLRR
jgi:hypothetical protein